MFDDTRNRETAESEAKLRANLRGFDRGSLKVLHPLFRDALRLLTHRDPPSKRDTALLPLVRPLRERQHRVGPSMHMYPVSGAERVPTQIIY